MVLNAVAPFPTVYATAQRNGVNIRALRRHCSEPPVYLIRRSEGDG